MSEQENKFTKTAENQDKARKRLQKNAVVQAFSEHGKVPPQAVDLEEAVLGALML